MWITRKDWGARLKRGKYTRLSRDNVIGVALHWPGITRPIHGVENVKRALRGWQALHMDTNGWMDIAYNEAIDQDGNVYRLRGLANQSAANGNQTVNRQYAALLLILAPGERPSGKMIRSVNRRLRKYAKAYPRMQNQVVAVRPHSFVRGGGTECPGDVVRDCIKRRVFHL